MNSVNRSIGSFKWIGLVGVINGRRVRDGAGSRRTECLSLSRLPGLLGRGRKTRLSAIVKLVATSTSPCIGSVCSHKVICLLSSLYICKAKILGFCEPIPQSPWLRNSATEETAPLFSGGRGRPFQPYNLLELLQLNGYVPLNSNVPTCESKAGIIYRSQISLSEKLLVTTLILMVLSFSEFLNTSYSISLTHLCWTVRSNPYPSLPCSTRLTVETAPLYLGSWAFWLLVGFGWVETEVRI